MFFKTKWLGLFGLILLSLIPTWSSGQVDEADEHRVEQWIESIGERNEGEAENSTLLEDYTLNREEPLNLNLANENQLKRLHLLDFRQIQNLMKYREQYGYLASLNELNGVEGFNPELVQSIHPFVTLAIPNDSMFGLKPKLQQRSLFRVKSSFPIPAGYRASSATKGAVYPGMPVSLYSRHQFELSKSMSAGLVTENDAGEPFFQSGNRWGFDYYSGYLSWEGKGVVRQLLIGDYQVNFGQGVSFGDGYALGKSSDVLGILHSGPTLRANTSSDENQFFRGISSIMAKGPFLIHLFYSNKRRDANLMTDPLTGEHYFIALQKSGLHRTVNELEDRRAIGEQVGGCYLDLTRSRFRVGAIASFQVFDHQMRTGSSAYKAYSFSGFNNQNYGFDYQWLAHHIQFFGEWGIGQNGRLGWLQGVVWNIDPRVNWSIYYRHFDPSFHAFYGNAITEGSSNSNESGAYTGLTITPLKKVLLSIYADFYHFPKLTYYTTTSSNGRDFLFQLDIHPNSKLSLTGKGRLESKPRKVTGLAQPIVDQPERVGKWRLHGEYILSRILSLRSRCEYVHYSFYHDQENGVLLYQDLVYDLTKKLRAWLRWCYFHTDGYNSRIYAYENDLLYSYSIPEFHGIGQRLYLNFRWAPSAKVTCYLKAGYTLHSGVTAWGSGYDLTKGNNRTEIRGLLSLRF